MFRQTLRGLHEHLYKYFKRQGSDSKKDKAVENDIAFETEYYYKQDKELLQIVKQKTQDEVKYLQDEVQAMRDKIEEYNRDINENLRFLKDLEKELPATNKKKP